MFQYVMTRIPLNTEEILKRVTQEEIFEIVFKRKINTHSKYLAPYRNDKNPSCFFKQGDNYLYFNDLAFSNIGINCFNFIQKVYNISFVEALQLINKELKIGLGDSSDELKKELPKTYFIEKEKEKKNVITPIHIEEKEFNEYDLKYWGLFGITKENLVEDSVKSLHSFIIGSEENFKGYMADRLSYAFTEFEKNKLKIYQPLSEYYKWRTNCNENDIGSIKHLTYNKDKIIITKSYKDCRVLRNLGFDSVWFQNETMIPSNDILKNIMRGYRRKYIFYDNDKAGFEGANKLYEVMYKMIQNVYDIPSLLQIPPQLNPKGIKDISDLYRLKGKDAVVRFFKSNYISINE